jgi:type I restriction enzyme S subunit
MKKWPVMPLGEIAELYQPKTITSAQILSEGPYKVFGANGVIGFYDKYNHVEAEVAVTCRGATCGTVNLTEPMSWITGNAMIVTPKNKCLDKRYLFYVLKASDMASVISGSAQPQITRQSFAPMKIPVPPIAEQDKIVKLLDEAEELRKLRAQADCRAAALIPALFHTYFGDPALNERRWPVFRFGELAADTRNGINPPKSRFGSGVPFVTVNNLYDGLEINTKALQSVNISVDEETKYKLFPGDICFARSSVKRNGVGMPSIFAANSPAVFGGFVIRVRLKPELNPSYTCSFFFLPSTRKRVIDAANSGTITNISQPSLLGIEIPVPPLPLQQEFAQRVKEIRELKANQAISRTRLDALFQSMLHRAFNGDL